MVFFACPSLSSVMQRPSVSRKEGFELDDSNNSVVESEFHGFQLSPQRMNGRLGQQRLRVIGDDNDNDKENNSTSCLRKRSSSGSTCQKRRKTTHNNNNNNSEEATSSRSEQETKDTIKAKQQPQKPLPVINSDYTQPLAAAAAEAPAEQQQGEEPEKTTLVKFQETTHIKEIPHYRDYPEEEHSNMYMSTLQIKQNADRNYKEYDADHWDWMNATEEDGFRLAHTGEMVHPKTYALLEEEECHRLKLLGMFEDESLFGFHSMADDWSDEEDDDEEDVRSKGCCNLMSSRPTSTILDHDDEYADFGFEISELGV